MYPFGEIPIAVLASSYLTWAWCRARRNQRWSGIAVVVAALIGDFLGLVSTFQFDLFKPSRWHGGGTLDVWIEILLAAVPSLLLSFGASLVVASGYKRKRGSTMSQWYGPRMAAAEWRRRDSLGKFGRYGRAAVDELIVSRD